MNMRMSAKVGAVTLAAAAALGAFPAAASATPAKVAPAAVRVTVCTSERHDYLKAAMIWPNSLLENGKNTYVGWWHDGRLQNASLARWVHKDGVMVVRVTRTTVRGYAGQYFILARPKCGV